MVPLPRLEVGLPESAGTSLAPGDVLQRWEDNAGRVIATGGRTRDGWWMRWSGLATFWFGTAGVVHVQPLRPGVESAVRDVFTRAVTPVVLLAQGFEGLHASAVLDNAGVVGFCGLSGTGKSTLALALAATGLQHFADDAVIYRVVGGRPVVFSIPFPVRVDLAAQYAVGPGTVPDRETVDGPHSAPLRRIYQLTRDGALDPGRPLFVPVPTGRRFETLLKHAHPFDMDTPERRRAFLENLLAVARTVDVWECRFAPGLEALPALAAAVRVHASRA